MDYGKMLGDSFAYTKEGVIENKNKWIKLIIATIILCLPLLGYVMKIYRDEKPAPEVENWGQLFINGLILAIILFIYMIPIYIVEFLVLGSAMASAMYNPGAMAGAGIGFIVLAILAIVIGLLLPIVQIRYARTGAFGEAFNFKAILDHIGRIGWVNYIIALIIVAIVVAIPVVILEFILFAIIAGLGVALSWIGFGIGTLIAVIVFLIVIPVFAVFEARYITQVFDSVTA